MKRLFVVAVGTLSMLLMSCGSGAVHISSPSEGQVFPRPQGGYPTSIYVTLDDQNAYDDTTITAFPSTAVSCPGGQGGPTICTVNSNNTNYQASTTVVIKATRGDYQDTRVIYIGSDPNAQGGTTPYR